MSLELVREVSRENPDLLPTNLGRTCYRHTQLLVEKLRARGHDAYLMCKTGNEGRYVPPGFTPFEITGLDGVTRFTCTGFSHDAIWCDGKQFDTIGSANEHDRPIYRVPGSNEISFDPASGPHIQATPVWNEIPRGLWRNNNPPLKGVAPTPIPQPHPHPHPQPQPEPVPVMPDYDALGGDAYWRAEIGVPLAEDMRTAGPAHGGGPLNEGSSMWFSRAIFRILHAYASGKIPDRAAIIKGVRNEWRAALTAQGATGLPPLP